jgi:hypothetical protein
MSKDQMTIATSAEATENAVLPMIREVHTEPGRGCPSQETLPPALTESAQQKSPAQWAYERIILYIQNFEKQLDVEHEIALGFTGGDAGVIRIEGLGYFDPDIVTFYGSNDAGMKTQLVQHVTQLNVMLIASPKPEQNAAPKRIGFELGRALEREETATS